MRLPARLACRVAYSSFVNGGANKGKQAAEPGGARRRKAAQGAGRERPLISSLKKALSWRQGSAFIRTVKLANALLAKQRALRRPSRRPSRRSSQRAHPNSYPFLPTNTLLDFPLSLFAFFIIIYRKGFAVWVGIVVDAKDILAPDLKPQIQRTLVLF